jgi:hypothetical protein
LKILQSILLLGVLTGGLLQAGTPASPPQGEFTIVAEITVKQQRSGYDLSRLYRLERGQGFAGGLYNDLNAVPRLDFELQSPGPVANDNIRIKISVPHFKGPGQYPVPTILTVPDPNQLDPNVHFMITNWQGSLYDKQRVKNKSVLQFRSNWYWTERRGPGKVVRSAPKDIGGVITITKAQNGWVTGDLLIVLYDDGEQIPFREGDDTNRAVLKGNFRVPISSLDKL